MLSQFRIPGPEKPPRDLFFFPKTASENCHSKRLESGRKEGISEKIDHIAVHGTPCQARKAHRQTEGIAYAPLQHWPHD